MTPVVGGVDVDEVTELRALAAAVSVVMIAAAGELPPGDEARLADALDTLGADGITPANLFAVLDAIADTADDGSGVDSPAFAALPGVWKSWPNAHRPFPCLPAASRSEALGRHRDGFHNSAICFRPLTPDLRRNLHILGRNLGPPPTPAAYSPRRNRAVAA